MAQRPVFIPRISGPDFVTAIPVEFVWHPGMSKSQKQKSIRSLHEAAAQTKGIRRILEISGKSEDETGVRLSAFNLRVQLIDDVIASVEALFQGSKVFSNGGPFTDIYLKDSREAKKDERVRASGQLIGFRCDNRDWPLYPQTVFYDWLYLSALRQNPTLAAKILEYDGFSDIEFNPQKSINCQAASAALYKALVVRGLFDAAMSSPEEFIRIHANHKKNAVPVQGELF